MKKLSKLCFSFFLITLTVACGAAWAQKGVKARSVVASPTSSVLLVENFNYPSGTPITSVGWTAHSAGGTNTIVTSSPSLTMTGYAGSGIGNAVALTTSGEDDNRSFPVQSSGSVYAAFLVNVSDASTDPAGGYFFHLGPDPISTTFRGRVFIKKDASNNVAFGISKALTTSTDIVFTPFSYSLNTTYLLVVKYSIVDGATNDTVSLFVGTSVPATEPAATVTASDTTQSDINPGTVALRQGSSTTAPTVRVDGIRVGTTWQSVTAKSNAQVSLDFNGDGLTDYGIFRHSGGHKTWYVLYNGASNFDGLQWGLDTDETTPADYDGDGKTDVAVWRAGPPDGSYFFILQSSDNTVRIDTFGQLGDNPAVVRDYDGDGKADVAVYRAGSISGAQSYFFFRGSLNNPTNGITYVPWGTNGDVPTSGDFDGDGKGDFAVRRDSSGSGLYFIAKSGGGVDYVYFGLSSDAMVPGDFDGDGKSDLAVARKAGSNGNFYWRESSTGNVIGPIVAGLPDSDQLAFGDYDGDGKTDIGLYRDSNGVFYTLNTASLIWSYQQFGGTGDKALGEWNVTGGN